MTTNTPTPAELVAEVEPVLRQYSGNAEADRRLAPEAMNALIDAGIIKMFVPRVYGGLELDPVSGVSVIEGLARVDAAASWVATLCSSLATFAALFPEQLAQEIFADPRAVCAGALFPPGAAEPVQGGYRITGQWSYASGSNYATWLVGQGIVMENGAPRMGAAGPELFLFFIPASEAEVLDNWHSLGMRGTGSHDFKVTDQFVPHHRVWKLGPWVPQNRNFAAEAYRLGAWLIPPMQACLTLGVARAAVDDLVALANARMPSFTQISLGDKPVVQDKIARASALVDAGRRYAYGTIAEAVEILRSQPKLNIEQGVPLALSGSFGVEAAVDAVDLVHSCAGTAAIREDQRFQQYFRDVHTLSQHAFSSAGRFESVGKLMLGKESDWPFYYL